MTTVYNSLTNTSNSSASHSSQTIPHSSVTKAPENQYGDDISKLQEMFGEKLSTYKIESIYKASGSDFVSTMDCLLKGPTSQAITKMLNARFTQCCSVKVQIDPSEAGEDFVGFYKSSRLDVTKQLQIQISVQPVVDVGGVRAQLYTTILDGFSQNRRIKLFEGPPRQ